MSRHVFTLLTAAFLIFAHAAVPATAAEDYEALLGAEPEAFDSADALVKAFTDRLAAGDKDGVLRLLGLKPEAALAREDFDDNFAEVQAEAAERLAVDSPTPDRRILILGDQLWPFPFPAVETNGKWAFDTVDGLDEIVNRRIGENELQTIATLRAYVDAQELYHDTDWDDDGVREYARRLVSTPGTYDGLYWPSGGRVPESPAGASINADEVATAAADGYFGYRYRILESQGANVAGGAYDYVINGNMIAGFALIAWPAEYGETGVQTFVVSHAGVVYEKDFGVDTAKIVETIKSFDPDASWTLVSDESD